MKLNKQRVAKLGKIIGVGAMGAGLGRVAKKVGNKAVGKSSKKTVGVRKFPIAKKRK